jgi:hypothetical protein
VGIFTKSNSPTTVAVDPRLPQGYDDPESPNTFIPEEIRDEYAQTERPPSDEVGERVESLAKQQVVAEARAELEAKSSPAGMSGGREIQLDMSSKAAIERFNEAKRALLKTSRREFEAIAEHQLRLETAVAAVALAQSLAQQKTSIDYWFTCRGCGTKGGTVTAIPQNPKAVMNLIGYQTAAAPLCTDCELELRAQQAARAQARTDVEARRRIGELLDRWES